MQKVFIRVVEDPGATIHVNMKSTWVKKAVVKAGCLARLGTSLNTALVGVLLSLVGSTRDPGAETLQWTRVRLLAQVPLLRVTPPLLPCFLTLFSCPVNKARKGQKNIFKKKTKQNTALIKNLCCQKDEKLCPIVL